MLSDRNSVEEVPLILSKNDDAILHNFCCVLSPTTHLSQILLAVISFEMLYLGMLISVKQ